MAEITRHIRGGVPVAERARWQRGTIFYALMAQAVILLVSGFVVVVAPRLRSDPEFTAGRTVYLPQRELEHRVALSEFQQSAAQPLQLEKLVTSALLPPDLPALPTVPRTDFSPMDDAATLSRDAQALLGQSGFAGAVGGLKSAKSTAAFFGIEDSGERIVIVVNTSVSVRNKAQRRGVSWEHIQNEVRTLIDGLDAGTQFAIVQFSQAVRVFPDYLAPATTANRLAAREWVGRFLKGNPPVADDQVWFGHETAFEAALRLEPDVVFLVTDGVLDRREVRNGRVAYPEVSYATFAESLRGFRRGSARDPRVHVIGFEMKGAGAEAMRKLAQSHGGRVREF